MIDILGRNLGEIFYMASVRINCHIINKFKHFYLFFHTKCSCPTHHVGQEHHENIDVINYGSHSNISTYLN